MGPGCAGLPGVGRDLARHRAADRPGHGHRRGQLERGSAAVPRTQRRPRRDLPHLLLQLAGRRCRGLRRHVLRGHRRDPPCDRPAPHGHAARADGRSQRHQPGAGGDAGPGAQSGRQPEGPAVHADLPVRRARHGPSGQRHGRGAGTHRGPVFPGCRQCPGLAHRRLAGWRPRHRGAHAGRRHWRGAAWRLGPTAHPGLHHADQDTGRAATGWLFRGRPEPLPTFRHRLPGLPGSAGQPDRGRHCQRALARGLAPAHGGAGADRPGQDGLFLEREPRVPHAFDADAGAPGGRAL